MSQSQRPSELNVSQRLLRLFVPPLPLPGCARWRVNGHPVRLVIWSHEEWEQLDERPADAQLHPYGVWCALRID